MELKIVKWVEAKNKIPDGKQGPRISNSRFCIIMKRLRDEINKGLFILIESIFYKNIYIYNYKILK